MPVLLKMNNTDVNADPSGLMDACATGLAQNPFTSTNYEWWSEIGLRSNCTQVKDDAGKALQASNVTRSTLLSDTNAMEQILAHPAKL